MAARAGLMVALSETLCDKKFMSPRQKRPNLDRFLEKLSSQNPSECWLYNGHVSARSGDGIFYFDCGEYAVNMQAHLASWRLHNRELKKGHWLFSTCGKQLCCNPNHLELAPRRVRSKRSDLRSKQQRQQDRFWARVNKTPQGCWNFGPCSDAFGYGLIAIDGKQVRAHRYSYELAYGNAGDKLVCHHCDNPSCVNPDHLFLGDHQDNTRDMMQKKRGVNLQGAEVHTAKLTDKDIPIIITLKKAGIATRDIADRYGLHRSTIRNIINGVAWRHVPR